MDGNQGELCQKRIVLHMNSIFLNLSNFEFRFSTKKSYDHASCRIATNEFNLFIFKMFYSRIRHPAKMLLMNSSARTPLIASRGNR